MPAEIIPRHRPSVVAALLSPTALTNLLAAVAVVVCQFFPRTGEIDALSIDDSVAANHRAIYIASFWPVGLGLCTFSVMLTLGFLRPSEVSRLLMSIPMASASVLGICWALLLFSDTAGSGWAMILAAIVVPCGTLIALRMWWLWTNQDPANAAAWGQGFLCVLAIFTLHWFYESANTRWMWGSWLSIAATASLLIASWTWPTRATYDLSDRKCEPQAFRITLRQLIAAAAVCAVAMTYWEYFGRL